MTALPSSEYPYDLGRARSRKITTTNAEAQKWFDYGLIWCYAFHHEEAIRCFEQCTYHDPDTVMGYWGIAYALGGDYNHQWKLFGIGEIDTVLPRIKEAVGKGNKAKGASKLERGLMNALDSRMPENEEDRDYAAWDKRYMDAMSGVYEAYPDDLDIAALYAESMMIQTPWNLWNLHTGEPNPESCTLEIERVLEKALLDPESDTHAGLLHFYIHLEEMSQHPEKAVVAGDKLLHLIPDGGHSTHMPSHLDILIGDYRRAITSNALAIEADTKYIKIHGLDGFFTTYSLHNYNSLIYAAMFNGQSKVALKYVTEMEHLLASDWCHSVHGDFMEAAGATRIHVLIRFGMWADLLEMPLPSDQVTYSVTTAFIHYGKGIAHAALNQIDKALKQQSLYLDAIARVPPTRLVFPNKASDVFKVGTAMLSGEIEYRRQNYDIAFAHLEESIVTYDALLYSEPWGWMQPTRHTYAALKLEQGEVEEAMEIYAEDLGLSGKLARSFWHPKNVWALHGYYECLKRLGLDGGGEGRWVKGELELALVVADIEIESSCFCRMDVKKGIVAAGDNEEVDIGVNGDKKGKCCTT
jgi:tetratricopeptide (TPR) repeat protein